MGAKVGNPATGSAPAGRSPQGGPEIVAEWRPLARPVRPGPIRPASQAGRHGFESRRPLCVSAARLASPRREPYIYRNMAFDAHRRSAGPSAPAQEWVARIRAGDEGAFEAMFRAYYDRLCRSVAPSLGS